MPKPWGRYEIGFMDHPKFLALTGNAISLWWEGKNYCDTHQTDGLIPKEALKTFRFRGAKSLELLMTPITMTKPDGNTYGPLWESHVVGYKMHDYLDHNDCRDKVLARIDLVDEQREIRKVKNRERQAEFRKRRQDMLRNAHVTPVTPTPTDTDTDTDPVPVKNTGTGAPARPMAPIHDTSHKKHAHCGRVCLHASLFGEFVRRRNHPDADREIRDWCLTIEREWGVDGPRGRVETGDAFDFWRARYAETWPAPLAEKPTARRGWEPKPPVSGPKSLEEIQRLTAERRRES